jgi:phosphoenolpyruvate carboxykinase (ATP)
MNELFGKRFEPRKIMDNPSEESLRDWALQHGGVITEFGNLAVTTSVRNRMAKLTEVIMDHPEPEALELVHAVMDYLKSKEMIRLDRVMCATPGFKKNCRLYVTAEYARLPLMWGNTLFPSEGKEPDFVTITVPEWEEKKVLVFPEMGLTLILGSDYKCGEQDNTSIQR